MFPQVMLYQMQVVQVICLVKENLKSCQSRLKKKGGLFEISCCLGDRMSCL